MASRTYNRRPVYFDGPTSKQATYNYFNHYTWKGLCTDRGNVNIDQQTFADSVNMYVDRNGLLASRPPVVKQTIEISSTEYDIVDVNSFGSWLAIVYVSSSIFYIVFKNGNQMTTPFSIGSVTSKCTYATIGKYIYFMNSSVFGKFDTENVSVSGASTSIYIPHTKVIGVGTTTDNEAMNVLTTSYYTDYTYNRELGYDPGLIGKSFKVDIDGVTKIGTFGNNDIILPIIKKFDLLLASNPIIRVSTKDSLLIRVEDKIYYSVNGTNLVTLPTLPEGEIKKIDFTRDGNHVFAVIHNTTANTKLVYMYSVVSTVANSDGSLSPRYPIWTDLGFSDVTSADFNDDDDGYFLSGLYVKRYYYGQVHQAALPSEYEDATDLTYVPGMTYSGNSYARTPSVGVVVFKATSGYYIAPVMKNTTYPDDRSYDFPQYTVLDSQMASHTIGKHPTFEGVVRLGYTDYYIRFIDTVSTTSVSLITTSVDIVTYDSALNVNVKLDAITDTSAIGISPMLDIYGQYILYNNVVYDATGEHAYRNLLYQGIPISFASTHYYKNYSNGVLTIYSSDTDKTFIFSCLTSGSNNLIDFDYSTQMRDHFFAKGKDLYISEDRDEGGESKWYLPETRHKEFGYPITGLHPISVNEVGIFFENEMWRTYIPDSASYYYFVKSRLSFGILAGNDVVTEANGTSSVFASRRGLTAFAYQDLISVEEQKATYLSDNIYDEMQVFCSSTVKITQHDFWIILYHVGSQDIYIYDLRTTSWWYIKSPVNVSKIIEYNNSVYLLGENHRLHLVGPNDDYRDYIGSYVDIDWSFKSQKLHLDAPNYTKTVKQMILLSSSLEDVLIGIKVVNYREEALASPTTIIDIVGGLKTVINRINSVYINSMQYTISSQGDSTPIELSGITLKYKVSGGVR